MLPLVGPGPFDVVSSYFALLRSSSRLRICQDDDNDNDSGNKEPNTQVTHMDSMDEDDYDLYYDADRHEGMEEDEVLLQLNAFETLGDIFNVERNWNEGEKRAEE